MAAFKTLKEALDALPTLLRKTYQFDHVVIRLHAVHNPHHANQNKIYQSLLERVAQGRSLCDDRPSQDGCSDLFGAVASEIRSTAMIPLGDKASVGLLGLGAKDATRFCPEMGTTRLDRLGELIGAGLCRLLASCPRTP